MNKLKNIGDTVTFNSRSGKIIGYWTGYVEPVQTFYVVKLDEKSSGYVLDMPGNDKRDMYVRLTLINVENNDG